MLSLFAETIEFKNLTGSGPGTRNLADVDTELSSILIGAGEKLAEAGKDEPLPPEVHEFALSAAFLMASADEHLDESELKCLEDTFSGTLDNWKSLLHQDQALKRFTELLPLAVSGGEPLAVSIFNLLVHVMLADTEIHLRELDTLAAIGRSLRQESLYECLLAAVARALRIERSAAPALPPLPALPPGAHEAKAALDGLFAGIARRGGATVPLMRLLRIMGDDRWSPNVLDVITKSAAGNQLELAAPPAIGDDGSARADQCLLFRLTESEQQRRDEAARLIEADGLAAATTRDALATALKHLRERLVSGDGRSPSVRLYRAAAGRHFDLALLDRVIAGRSERIVTLLHETNSIPLLSGNEAGIHKTAGDTARAVRYLEREFKARVEETGTRDFYAGYPFLVGNIGGFFVRAPLILHPFSLTSDGRGAGSFALKRRDGDEPCANQALIRLLFAKKGFPFTDELATELDAKAAEGCDALLATLRQVGLDARPLSGTVLPFEEMSTAAGSLLPEGVAVAEHAVIGFYPQSSSDLLQDYDEMLAKLQPGSTESLERSLNAACGLLPTSYRPEFAASNEARGLDQPVVYSDPSQRAAVVKSRSCRLLVMDGPPGTGKSQTIVNLIADTLATGGCVAVVCEKRVALDVVKQRMDGAGLGHLAAVVHDVYDDRKALYTRVADRLEAIDRKSFDDVTLIGLRRECADIEGQLSARSALLEKRGASGLSIGQLHAMAAAFAVPSAAVAGMAALRVGELPRLTKAARELRPYADLWAAGAVFHGGRGGPARPSLADATAADLATIAAELSAATAAVREFETRHAALPLDPSLVDTAAESLRLAGQVTGADDDWFGSMLARRAGQASTVGGIEDLFSMIDTDRDAAASESSRVKFETPPEWTGALATARLHAGSWLRHFLPAWYQCAGRIRRHLAIHWPEQAAAPVTPALLAAIERRQKAARVWSAAESLFRAFEIQSTLPRTASELLVRVDAMVRDWQLSARLARHRPALESLGLWPGSGTVHLPEGGWPVWVKRCQDALQLLESYRTAEIAAKTAAIHFPHAASHDAAGWQQLADNFAVAGARLVAGDRQIKQLEPLLAGGPQLAAELASLPVTSSAADWADAVTRGWAEQHLAAEEAADPTLRVLDQAPPLGGLERASARLLELHQAIASEEALRLSAANDHAGLMAVPVAEARARRTPEQANREAIIRECRKQRNVMPMRTLVRRYATAGLLDTIPVWLMSPETTAILFPREPVFDLLIVDEASQCTVENGLPVLTRARRAVVAGDDKQMPPSSFFKAATGLDASEGDADAEVAADSFESESLLVLARQSAAGAPLRWHYRALFEELIAFSNHSMYGGSLLTIPSTLSRSAPPAMSWVRLDDGVWDGGCNLPEAKKVVALLGEQLSQPHPPSVGIVTFNLQQRRAILDEIDARRGADESFARAYDTAMSAELMDARPFVKNLESVQGDERDLIIFSLGYAPASRKRRDGTMETYVPARFGPLGQKGGERRLNVAVSRAKKAIIVVSSFDPSLLSVAHTKNDGPRMFKAFVEFARHLGEGKRTQAEKILALVNDGSAGNGAATPPTTVSGDLFLPLHHQIAQELERHGMRVETMIGTSEFRLPVAVVCDGDAHSYQLAVLCDDGGLASDVYENYVHIPNVLAHRGWSHVRITSREWHRDRESSINRIRAELLR